MRRAPILQTACNYNRTMESIQACARQLLLWCERNKQGQAELQGETGASSVGKLVIARLDVIKVKRKRACPSPDWNSSLLAPFRLYTSRNPK